MEAEIKPDPTPEERAAILADRLSLDPWRVLAFTYAYACLNASWWLELGGSDIVQWALNVAVIIEPHLELSQKNA